MPDNSNRYQKGWGNILFFYTKIVQGTKSNLLSKKCNGAICRNAMILINSVLTLINIGLQISANQEVKATNTKVKIAKNNYVINAISCIFILTLLSNKCYL